MQIQRIDNNNINKLTGEDLYNQEINFLQIGLCELESNVNSGNLVLQKQTEQLNNINKNIIYVENNNKKINWMQKTSKSFFSMIKGIFTKPNLQKDNLIIEPEHNLEILPEYEVTYYDDNKYNKVQNSIQNIKRGVCMQSNQITYTTYMCDTLNNKSTDLNIALRESLKTL